MPVPSISEFPYVPASKRSLSQRRTIQGVGINDAPYTTGLRRNSKLTTCPFYTKWLRMIHRCYDPLRLNIEKNRYYRDATVCDEWLRFMVFREWMDTQQWQGLELDKDIRSPGNNIYSPGECIFVSRSVNTLFTGSRGNRGLPRGVSWHNVNKKYYAHARRNNALLQLGGFDTPEDASLAYRKAKREIILDLAAEQTDHRVRDGLLRHAALLI